MTQSAYTTARIYVEHENRFKLLNSVLETTSFVVGALLHAVMYVHAFVFGREGSSVCSLPSLSIESNKERSSLSPDVPRAYHINKFNKPIKEMSSRGKIVVALRHGRVTIAARAEPRPLNPSLFPA
jgi:hypothetical protein